MVLTLVLLEGGASAFQHVVVKAALQEDGLQIRNSKEELQLEHLKSY